MQKLDVSMILWLVAASISFCFSVLLWFFVNKEYGIFVGVLGAVVSFSPCELPAEPAMTLNMVIGAVGIVAFTLAFVAGLLAVSRQGESR